LFEDVLKQIFLEVKPMSHHRDFSDAPDEDTAGAERVKCSKCFRELKFSAEWICTRDRILCDRCYLGLLYPNSQSRNLESLD
jgi:hypothetical protein